MRNLKLGLGILAIAVLIGASVYASDANTPVPTGSERDKVAAVAISTEFTLQEKGESVKTTPNGWTGRLLGSTQVRAEDGAYQSAQVLGLSLADVRDELNRRIEGIGGKDAMVSTDRIAQILVGAPNAVKLLTINEIRSEAAVSLKATPVRSTDWAKAVAAMAPPIVLAEGVFVNGSFTVSNGRLLSITGNKGGYATQNDSTVTAIPAGFNYVVIRSGTAAYATLQGAMASGKLEQESLTQLIQAEWPNPVTVSRFHKMGGKLNRVRALAIATGNKALKARVLAMDIEASAREAELDEIMKQQDAATSAAAPTSTATSAVPAAQTNTAN